jgi:O-antigen ligase
MRSGSVRTVAKHLTVTALVGIALIVATYRSDSMMSRYQKTVETGSLSGREQIYPTAWEMVRERPIVGWGPIDNTYELGQRVAGFTIGEHNAAGVAAKPYKDTHNLTLDVLTSTGIVGATPLFLCIASCIGAAWTARRGPRGTTPLSLVTVVLMLSMDANWSASKQGWLMLSYAAASRRRVRVAQRASVAASMTATDRLRWSGAA